MINLVPGVSFPNNDAYGTSGGNIRIRGFDGNRISLTFDGIPLNDSGNYAIFSNQQLDPELIEQVNVSLGITDVDCRPLGRRRHRQLPHAHARPTTWARACRVRSASGRFPPRASAMFDTGEIGPWGTRGLVSASHADNDKFNDYGQINKYQYNAKIYQPIGTNGDFISVAGHYNQNRNNFYRNPSSPTCAPCSASTEIHREQSEPPPIDTPIRIGYFDQLAAEHALFAATSGSRTTRPALSNNRTFSGCSNFYEVRINPSNTGNIRGQSRFTLRDGLLLTVDPSYQYVLANGGGTFTLRENSARAKGSLTASPGVDYNGDGDFARHRPLLHAQHHQHQPLTALTSSLIWDIAADHRVRVAYTFDRAHHRQTGEWGFLQIDGHPESPFSGRNATPVHDRRRLPAPAARPQVDRAC